MSEAGAKRQARRCRTSRRSRPGKGRTPNTGLPVAVSSDMLRSYPALLSKLMALCRFRRYLFQSGQPGGRWPLTHPPPAPEHRARYRSRPLLLSPSFLAQGDTSENMGMQRNDFSKFLRSCSCIEDDAWGGGRCAGRPLVPAVVAGCNGAGSISGSAFAPSGTGSSGNDGWVGRPCPVR